MPIQAAANKLKEEITRFGNPPIFPNEDDEDPSEEKEKTVEASIASKSKGKQTKLISKGLSGNKVARQWDILSKMVPVDEIASFVDPLKWLDYFPPFGAQDLQVYIQCSLYPVKSKGPLIIGFWNSH